MVSEIIETIHMCVWIAQDTTESKEPRLNVNTNQISVHVTIIFGYGTLDSVVFSAIHTFVRVRFSDFACHSYQHNVSGMLYI